MTESVDVMTIHPLSKKNSGLLCCCEKHYCTFNHWYAIEGNPEVHSRITSYCRHARILFELFVTGWFPPLLFVWTQYVPNLNTNAVKLLKLPVLPFPLFQHSWRRHLSAPSPSSPLHLSAWNPHYLLSLTVSLSLRWPAMHKSNFTIFTTDKFNRPGLSHYYISICGAQQHPTDQ